MKQNSLEHPQSPGLAGDPVAHRHGEQSPARHIGNWVCDFNQVCDRKSQNQRLYKQLFPFVSSSCQYSEKPPVMCVPDSTSAVMWLEQGTV